MSPLFERSWARTWLALTGRQDEARRDELLARYAEPQRKYHSTQHLSECLQLCEEFGSLAQHPAEVEAALWFHDAIYEVKGAGNEERSADWAFDALQTAGASPASAALVRDLVLVTRHSAVPAGTDEQLVVDIDLSILGADRARFDEYEQQIREEYAYVPGIIFRHKRRQILQSFLDRADLYSLPPLKARLEARARENLRRVIGR
ncbi:N-methyl-D-aspartate receptor NMDAR2C subunit [Roseateles sp. SL47]|uniref:HD domain-containing protein n=1 Tax=Roseateles sp. SL47 TaxID=2995138 RepID=UPI002271C244|nr:N-methyl-D-aspartate receptor NMDAR2C subunit [Roseateles sp. SL47]WAC75025.1 N-methyl-D-aspartate receptor NMDAR2C subunit [Roseateles sp. SL47]